MKMNRSDGRLHRRNLNMTKKKVVLFGAGADGKLFVEHFVDDFEILCFLDNNEKLWDTKVMGIPVRAPISIRDMEFDLLFIQSRVYHDEILEQAKSLGIEESKVISGLTYTVDHWRSCARSRALWVRHFAKFVYENQIRGSVAEAGVFRGAFAKVINGAFPDRECFLFDTFSGFDARDIKVEEQRVCGINIQATKVMSERLTFSRIDEFLNGFPHPEKCIVRKGYFPETAQDLSGEFCFVNLDMDLYKPIYEGLKLFFPLLNTNGRGVILVHDYFDHGFMGVKEAVVDFCRGIGKGIGVLPVGDGSSVCITKWDI